MTVQVVHLNYTNIRSAMSLQAHLIALAQMYSAALADGRCSLLAMSEREIREYDTEIFLRPVESETK